MHYSDFSQSFICSVGKPFRRRRRGVDTGSCRKHVTLRRLFTSRHATRSDSFYPDYFPVKYFDHRHERNTRSYQIIGKPHRERRILEEIQPPHHRDRTDSKKMKLKFAR